MLEMFCHDRFGVLFYNVVLGSRYTLNYRVMLSVVPVSKLGVCLGVTLHIVDLWRYYVLLLLLLLKEVGSARLRESDIHPISPKTPGKQYYPTDRNERKKENRVYNSQYNKVIRFLQHSVTNS